MAPEKPVSARPAALLFIADAWEGALEINFWVERDRWPYIRPSLAFFPEVFDEVGSAIFGASWTFREMSELPIEPELPSPTKVFIGDSDAPADVSLYNRFRDRAFDLLGVAPGHLRQLPISWEQWRRARERWVAIELAEISAQPRRLAVFRLLHDAAAEGTLRFTARLPDGGRSAELSPSWWDLSYDVVLARFVTCAMPSKIEYARMAPPNDPDKRTRYYKGFDLPLVVSRQNLRWAIPHLVSWHEGSIQLLPAYDSEGSTATLNLIATDAPSDPASPIGPGHQTPPVAKKPPHRPGKRADSLDIFRARIEGGQVKQDRAQEAYAITRVWSKEGPPKQDTVSGYLRPFYDIAQWQDGKMSNASEVLDALDKPIKPM